MKHTKEQLELLSLADFSVCEAMLKYFQGKKGKILVKNKQECIDHVIVHVLDTPAYALIHVVFELTPLRIKTYITQEVTKYYEICVRKSKTQIIKEFQEILDNA